MQSAGCRVQDAECRMQRAESFVWSGESLGVQSADWRESMVHRAERRVCNADCRMSRQSSEYAEHYGDSKNVLADIFFPSFFEPKKTSKWCDAVLMTTNSKASSFNQFKILSIRQKRKFYFTFT